MIMNAGEDVGQICLRVETVQLRSFNDGHCAGKGFRAGVSPRE